MEPLRRSLLVIYDDRASVVRAGADWAFEWSWTDVNSMVGERVVCTTEELTKHGPPVRMTADDLDTLARRLGQDPAALAWCRERRLVERIAANDVAGVGAQLAAIGVTELPTLAMTGEGQREPILAVALGVAAWAVATELVSRGEPLAAPPDTPWSAASYAIEALDDSDGATVVLQRLIASGALVPSASLLRYVRAPRIAHILVDGGARVDVLPPPDVADPSMRSPLEKSLIDATPLGVAVSMQRLDVAAALVARGAAIEQRDAQGCTALYMAVWWGREAPVRWLLERGADPDAATVTGTTPRSLALARPDDPGSRVLLRGT